MVKGRVLVGVTSMSLHVNLRLGVRLGELVSSQNEGQVIGQRSPEPQGLSVLRNQSGKLINDSLQSIHTDQTSPGGRGLVSRPGRHHMTSHVH